MRTMTSSRRTGHHRALRRGLGVGLATVLVAPLALIAAGPVASATEVLCLSGRSDGFAGSTLDADRWSVLRPDGNLRLDDGHLVMPTSQTDIFGTNNNGTPNIVLQDLPDGAFTATTKVTVEANRGYQQAGLIVYGDDDNYAKMVLQGRDTASANPAERIFQFIREENGAPNELGDSNTPALGAAYPSTVWVRFTSDGTSLTASYSPDGVTYTQMPETKSLTGLTDPRIGLFALQGTDQAQAPVDAAFDYFSIVPDGAVPAVLPDDEFDGTALDGCRWDVVRHDPAHLRVDAGQLELDATAGDIRDQPNGSPSNFVLQPQPEGDWVVETLVDAGALEQDQHAGLMAYVDDDTYVTVDVVTTNSATSPPERRIELVSEENGVAQVPLSAGPLDQARWHLRLEKSGDTLTGYYSTDGTTWTSLGAVTNAQVAASGRTGLYALGSTSSSPATARFDYFRLLDETAPTLEVTLDPADPTGDNGWFVGPVRVTATASDDVDAAGQLTIEQRLDGGAWTIYSGPVSLTTDGEHQLELRASDSSGNTSATKTVSVSVDATAPTVAVSGAAEDGSYAVGDELRLSATAVDATSGLASLVLTLDGEEIDSGSVHALAIGDHELMATATDQAGNTSVASTFFEVRPPTVVEVQDAVGAMYADGQIHVSVWRQVDNHLNAFTRFLHRGQVKQGHKALDRALAAAHRVDDPAVRDALVELLGHLDHHLE